LNTTPSVREQIRLLGNISPVDLDFLDWSILLVCLDQAELLDYLHTTLHPAKNGVLSVQPWCRSQCNEELGPVRVGTGVGHAENASAGVLQRWGDLVLKLLAVDGCATSSGAGRITTLDHKVRYDAVEYEAVKVVTLGECREVLACLWRVVVVKLNDNGALLWSASYANLSLAGLTAVVSSATSVAMLYVNAQNAGIGLRTVMVTFATRTEQSTGHPQPQLRHTH
jgi:hypothetical protein